MAGQDTSTLDAVPLIDDFIGNRGGSTVRIEAAKAAAQFFSQIGPQVTTLAQLNADLSWPGNTYALVLGDTAARNGQYRKLGAAGSGSWTRTGDTPQQIVRDRSQHTGVQGMETVEGLVTALAGKVSLAILAEIGAVRLTNIGGTIQDMTATVPDGVTLASGWRVRFQPPGPNTGPDPKILGLTIKRADGAPLVAGDLQRNREVAGLIFGTELRLGALRDFGPEHLTALAALTSALSVRTIGNDLMALSTPQGDVLLIDNFGHVRLTDMNGESVQEAIDRVTREISRVRDAAPGFDQTPQLRKLTDAQNRVFEAVDEYGQHYIPDMGGVSTADAYRSMMDRLKKVARPTRIYDAVRDLGMDPSGMSDITPQLQAAMDRISAGTDRYGPGGIYFPNGVFRMMSSARPRSHVTLIGAGWDRSRFLPYRRTGAFVKDDTATEPLVGFNCIDLDIDGSEQIWERYTVVLKGIFVTHFHECLFVGNKIHDTGATGMGIDYASKSFIMRNLVQGCGRLAAVGQPGASGIGIGTGALLNEPLVILGNHCIDNRNFGIFVEWQRFDFAWQKARQTIVNANVCTGNQHGYGDCGTDGTIVTSNQFNDNLGSGVMMDTGTLASWDGRPQPGGRTLYGQNQIMRNGGAGIEYDARRMMGLEGLRGFSTHGNRIEDNAREGIVVRGADNVIDDFAFRGDDIVGNGGHGLHMAEGSFRNVDIMLARFLRNGGSAVQIDAALRGGRLAGSVMRDLRDAATQLMAVTGAGNLTDFDFGENQYVGPSTAPVNLTGAKTRVTYGRNPGFGALAA